MRGAHCPPVNGFALGVALIGTFTDAEVPEAQKLGCLALVARLKQAHRGIREVCGHREKSATVCPGRGGMAVVEACEALA
jgi:hypothetical protein